MIRPTRLAGGGVALRRCRRRGGREHRRRRVGGQRRSVKVTAVEGQAWQRLQDPGDRSYQPRRGDGAGILDFADSVQRSAVQGDAQQENRWAVSNHRPPVLLRSEGSPAARRDLRAEGVPGGTASAAATSDAARLRLPVPEVIRAGDTTAPIARATSATGSRSSWRRGTASGRHAQPGRLHPNRVTDRGGGARRSRASSGRPASTASRPVELWALVSNRRPATYMYTWPALDQIVIQRPRPAAPVGLELARILGR